MATRSAYRTSNYAIVAADIGSVQTFTTTSGSLTVDLPAASASPLGFKITIAHDPASTGGNTLTAIRNGSDKIHNVSGNKPIDLGNIIDFYSNGVDGWFAFSSIANQLQYQGTWDANANSPSLASGVGTIGFYYVVSTAGSTTLDLVSSWAVGDWAVFNGTAWEKVVSSITSGVVTAALGYTPMNVAGDTILGPIRFLGITNAYPMFVRNGTGVDVKLADNSAYTDLTGANLLGSTSIITAAAGKIGFVGRSFIQSPSDGTITLLNAALSNFTMLQFGDTGAGAPGLKRSSAALSLRLANDSDYADFLAKTGTYSGALIAYNGTGIPAGGTAGTGIKFSSVSNFGIFFGSGSPTLSAARGSLYLQYDGPPSYNNNGSTQWTAIEMAIPGLLTGLTLSTAGLSSTFGVATGQASNSLGTARMALGSAFTKTTASWAVGTGNGALDTPSIANNTWYHVFLIKRPDTGLVDVLLSLSPTSPALPTDYTHFRRIGSMQTNGSGQWVKFIQYGDKFYRLQEVGYTIASTAVATLRTLAGIPTGIVVEPMTSVLIQAVNNNTGHIQFAPAADATMLFTAGLAYEGSASEGSANTVHTFGPPTNTSAQIYIAVPSASGGSMIVYVYGWVDDRGRNG